MLFSCESKKEEAAAGNDASIMSEFSEDMSIVMSQNGRRSYFFEAPLLEGYTLGPEPYREFRKGIKITTYQDDSLAKVDLVLTANYAIYYEKRELWEARGNVRGRGEDGRRLYTQQIFWDEKTDKVYSNVDTKVVDGDDVFVGEGFESDSEFKDWVFRESEGRMWVDASQGEGDQTAEESDKAAEKDKKEGEDKKRDGEDDKNSKPAVKEREGKVVKPITPPSNIKPINANDQEQKGRLTRGKKPGFGNHSDKGGGELPKADRPASGSVAKK